MGLRIEPGMDGAALYFVAVGPGGRDRFLAVDDPCSPEGARLVLLLGSAKAAHDAAMAADLSRFFGAAR